MGKTSDAAIFVASEKQGAQKHDEIESYPRVPSFR